jgi:hypothetical protein
MKIASHKIVPVCVVRTSAEGSSVMRRLLMTDSSQLCLSKLLRPLVGWNMRQHIMLSLSQKRVPLSFSTFSRVCSSRACLGKHSVFHRTKEDVFVSASRYRLIIESMMRLSSAIRRCEITARRLLCSLMMARACAPAKNPTLFLRFPCFRPEPVLVK